MSTLHPDVEIPYHNNPNIKPETVLFYAKTKAGANVIDQMASQYSVKPQAEGGPFTHFTMLFI